MNKLGDLSCKEFLTELASAAPAPGGGGGAAMAGALAADYFILISDVPGVLDAEGRLITSLTRAEIEKLRAEGVITGGMIPKVESCLHALDAGCQRALILDGRSPSSLRRYLLDDAPLGTVVVN